MDKTESYKGVFGASGGEAKRPVVLAVDFIRAYTEESSPFFAPGVVEAVSRAGPFYDAMRRAGVPIIHTRVLYDTPRPDAQVFLNKVPALRRLVTGELLAEFDPAVAPDHDDAVLVKQHASAFYGTDLGARLNVLEADSVIVTGCTTSGCIRATVVDVMQHGYLPLIAEDLVGDRHPEPHEANMFDMTAKYADALTAAQLLETFTQGGDA